MKRKQILSVITILLGLILFTSCSKPVLKADNPGNTAIALQNYLKAGNIESFAELFSESRKNSVTTDQFDELKKNATANTDYKHYELVTFSNGEMMLVLLTQDKINGEYKVEDAKKVPDEMKDMFK